MRGLIIRLWAFVTGGIPVWLIDFDGEETLSIAYRRKSGRIVAERHWPLSIRKCELGDEGQVIGGFYVKRWERA